LAASVERDFVCGLKDDRLQKQRYRVPTPGCALLNTCRKDLEKKLV
jgi:hypothetical protein